MLSLFFLGLCFLILQSFHTNRWIREYIGDMIIVMLIYSFLQSIKDFDPIRLSVFVIGFSFSVEILQYIKIISFLGFKENYITKIIFGSVFDPLDLTAYLIGTVFILYLDRSILRKLLIKKIQKDKYERKS